MSTGLNLAARNNQVDFIAAQYDAAATPGTIKVYSAPRPSTGGGVGAAVLLGTYTLASTSFPASVNGQAVANPIVDAPAIAAGTAYWARGEDGDGNFVKDVSVGLLGSGAELKLKSLEVEDGGTLKAPSYTIIAGNP